MCVVIFWLLVLLIGFSLEAACACEDVVVVTRSGVKESYYCSNKKDNCSYVRFVSFKAELR